MIKESVTLPSLGYPYKGRLEGTSVAVSPITTRVYKDFIVSNSEEGLLNLVDSCLVDCPLKAEDFCYADILAIYLKIRSISLGSIIPTSSTCPSCGRTQTTDWELSKIECNYLGLDAYPIQIVLPESKEKLYLEIPTIKSGKMAKEEAQKRATRYNKKVSDYLDTFSMLICVRSDQGMDLVSRSEWYETLPLKDAMFLDQAFSLIQDFGLVTVQRVICKDCDHPYNVPLRVNREFFRPSIGNLNGFRTTKGTLEEGPAISTKNE